MTSLFLNNIYSYSYSYCSWQGQSLILWGLVAKSNIYFKYFKQFWYSYSVESIHQLHFLALFSLPCLLSLTHVLSCHLSHSLHLDTVLQLINNGMCRTSWMTTKTAGKLFGNSLHVRQMKEERQRIQATDQCLHNKFSTWMTRKG